MTDSVILSSAEIPLKIKLTDWLVEQRRLGESRPEISTYTIKGIEPARLRTVFERADNLLRFLDHKSDRIGAVFKFYQLDNEKIRDFAFELLAWTSSETITEVITLAEYCKEQNWIEHKVTPRPSGPSNTLHEIQLKPRGFARLAELAGAMTSSTKAFVAMWFSSEVNAAFSNGIEPAIRDAGYDPIRIDKQEFITKIDDEIIAEIRRARFVVSDLTCPEKQPRANVYYEAGFAQGLNIPVVLTVRKDVLQRGDVQFDLRQFNYIDWETPEELHDRLKVRIEAVIGDGPLKKP